MSSQWASKFEVGYDRLRQVIAIRCGLEQKRTALSGQAVRWSSGKAEATVCLIARWPSTLLPVLLEAGGAYILCGVRSERGLSWLPSIGPAHGFRTIERRHSF